MSELPLCPECQSLYVYQDANLLICPDCAYEWSQDVSEATKTIKCVRDANGTELRDGDTVTVIKDLKIKGASSVIKMGTKVKNIRIVEGDHDIDCKILGIGQMGLKSAFVKKVANG